MQRKLNRTAFVTLHIQFGRNEKRVKYMMRGCESNSCANIVQRCPRHDCLYVNESKTQHTYQLISRHEFVSLFLLVTCAYVCVCVYAHRIAVNDHTDTHIHMRGMLAQARNRNV